MLNIMILGCEGPNAPGLAVLREATAWAYPTARPSVFSTKFPQPDASFARPNRPMAAPEQLESNHICFDATPGEILATLFLDREPFHLRPWDLVLVGVGSTLALGFDVFTKSTSATAMSAAAGLNTSAMSFNYDPEDPDDRSSYVPAEKVIAHFLRTTAHEPGACWNVNIPRRPTLGFISTKTAHYSPTRIPPTSLVPRARDEKSDVTTVEENAVAVTELHLKTNSNLRY